jgi:hypothetical protein
VDERTGFDKNCGAIFGRRGVAAAVRSEAEDERPSPVASNPTLSAKQKGPERQALFVWRGAVCGRAHRVRQKSRSDFWTSRRSRKSVVLLVEAKKAVYPRDVRQVLWQFKALNLGRHAGAQTLLIAESLSPGAKELLRAERIGYYEHGGSLFLQAPGALMGIFS